MNFAPLGKKRRPGGLFVVDVSGVVDVSEESLNAMMGEKSADGFRPRCELPHRNAMLAGRAFACPVDDEHQKSPEHAALVGRAQNPLVEAGDCEPGAFLGP